MPATLSVYRKRRGVKGWLRSLFGRKRKNSEEPRRQSREIWSRFLARIKNLCSCCRRRREVLNLELYNDYIFEESEDDPVAVLWEIYFHADMAGPSDPISAFLFNDSDSDQSVCLKKEEDDDDFPQEKVLVFPIMKNEAKYIKSMEKADQVARRREKEKREAEDRERERREREEMERARIERERMIADERAEEERRRIKEELTQLRTEIRNLVSLSIENAVRIVTDYTNQREAHRQVCEEIQNEENLQ